MGIKHTLTEKDFEDNPQLVEKGYELGQEIDTDDLGSSNNQSKPETKEVNQKVEMSQKDYAGIMATIAKLTENVDRLSRGETLSTKLPKVKFRTARLHFYTDPNDKEASPKPIVNIGTAWEEMTAEKTVKEDYDLNLEIFVQESFKKDKKGNIPEPVKRVISHKAFTESIERKGLSVKDYIIHEVITIDEGEKEVGITDLVQVDYENYRSTSIGKVALMVTTPVYKFVMKESEDSKQLIEVDPRAVN